jgi:hypothetical protein
MLIKTSTPHSITNGFARTESSVHESPRIGLRLEEPPSGTISEAGELPTRAIYRRPDLRQVGRDAEKSLTFELEANRIKDHKEGLTFRMPMRDGTEQELELTVELRRSRSVLRGTVRLRSLVPRVGADLSDVQLEFDFGAPNDPTGA